MRPGRSSSRCTRCRPCPLWRTPSKVCGCCRHGSRQRRHRASRISCEPIRVGSVGTSSRAALVASGWCRAAGPRPCVLSCVRPQARRRWCSCAARSGLLARPGQRRPQTRWWTTTAASCSSGSPTRAAVELPATTPICPRWPRWSTRTGRGLSCKPRCTPPTPPTATRGFPAAAPRSCATRPASDARPATSSPTTDPRWHRLSWSPRRISVTRGSSRGMRCERCGRPTSPTGTW